MTLKTKARHIWHENMTTREREQLVFYAPDLDSLLSGVLTKADMVTPADLEHFQRWKTIICGDDKDHRLVHGYYITMQRRPTPDSTWADNLANELSFFENDPTWKIFPQTMQHVVGTIELRRKLSTELSRLIKNR